VPSFAGFPGVPLLKAILKQKGIIDCSLTVAPLRELGEEECRRVVEIVKKFDNCCFRQVLHDRVIDDLHYSEANHM
jgi:hypothetical protein